MRREEYSRRTIASRCGTAECYCRGYPVMINGISSIRCAVRLQEALSEAVIHQAEPVHVAHPDVSRKVSARDDSVEFSSPTAEPSPVANEGSINPSANPAASADSQPSETRIEGAAEMCELFGPRKSEKRKKTEPGPPKESKRKKKGRYRSSSGLPASIESRARLFRRSLTRRPPPRSHRGRTLLRSRGSRHRERSRSPNGSAHSSHSRPGTIRFGGSAGSSVKLPSFLQQPLPSSAEAPVTLRDDPRLQNGEISPGKARQTLWHRA